MLRFISWTDFLSVILILLLFYWFVVGLAYYNGELMGILNKSSKPVVFNSQQKNRDNEGLFDRCNDCASILKTLIRKSSLEQPSKDRLISEIKTSLSPFRDFKGTIWQTPINNLIKYESLQTCSLQMDESDMHAIWN
jgi:hypothetical protein